ncbi:MAG: hypothetical protein IT531_17095 [Burkholderiales bacterium]|nr:hypothetical protein [Burkholderiales bacterium]
MNFNRLLEERAQVIDELQRLRRVQLDGCPRAALREICRASACLDQAAKTRVDELLGRDDAG